MKRLIVIGAIISILTANIQIPVLATTNQNNVQIQQEDSEGRIPIIEKVSENIEEVKEVIVDTDNIDDILSKYKEYEYVDSDGNKAILTATDVIGIEVANQKEDYWETLESISKEITISYEEASNIGSKFANLTENGKNYELTDAQFTPIEFVNNKPSKYVAKLTYTTINPNYTREINSYKAKIKYIGNIEKEKVVGYKQEEVKENNIVPIVVGTTVGTGTFIVVLWFFFTNAVLLSNGKKVKGYRKNAKMLEFDITKEIELYTDLEIVIKKRLAKKLDNTLCIIKANGKELRRDILNSSDNELKITIK